MNTYDVLEGTSGSAEKIEGNKDKTDLKPNVDFVSKYKSYYEEGLGEILKKNPSTEVVKWADGILFTGIDNIASLQLSPSDCVELLSRMPPVLTQLSDLKKICYT